VELPDSEIAVGKVGDLDIAEIAVGLVPVSSPD
jgi:hypothetical protein